MGTAQDNKIFSYRHCTMQSKIIFILLGLMALATVQAGVIKTDEEPEADVGDFPVSATVYDQLNHRGNMRRITKYCPDLSTAGMDNAISSVCATGIWLFYNETNYNARNSRSGMVYFHGINYCGNFNTYMNNQASSVRYAGSNSVFDQSTFALYDNQYFMGEEYYGETSQSDLRSFNARAESVIITGTSGWTFYTGSDYQGYRTCVKPTTTDSAGSQVMHLALYKQIPNNVFVNSIRSVRKGCSGDDIMEALPLPTIHEDTNGGMGAFDIENEVHEERSFDIKNESV